MSRGNEDQLLHSVALKNAQSILEARRRAEQELLEAKQALEQKTKELAQSLSFVRVALESTADGILATNQRGGVTEFNQNFVELWKIPEEAVGSREHRKIVDAMAALVVDPKGFVSAIGEIIANSPPVTMDVLELSDGRVLEQFSRVQELDGRTIGRLWSYRDVTDRVRAEEALRAAKEAAEEANRVKSEFLAVMSHELRTPLNAIGGYVDLLEMGIHGEITEAQKTALNRIKSSQRHLLILINDVLAFAKIEAGQLAIDRSRLVAREILSSVEPLLSPLAAAKGVLLSIRECDASVAAIGDEERVRQVLLNLIGNAIKYTPEGGSIDLLCERGIGGVEFRVSDDGPGIPTDKHETIFDPFVQVERRLSNPAEGVGLGLAISRDLARAMGGELHVRSVPGVGSTFTLSLPEADPEK